MPVLPVPVERALTILNLRSDERIIALFGEHSQVVLLFLKRVSDEDTWQQLLDESAYDDASSSYTFSYCYLLLASTLEFLNLKTIGEGIIKTTGIDTQQTELLTGGEIQSFKKHLSIKALENIEEYLNADGFERLRELKLGTSRLRTNRTKATVI
ncbi:MAG: hypothetical protein K8R90_02135 [Candidatus Cloacimonetes bacterium]|nr:hypothetical protein [Candidatus Cloacimonadota bacterium]